FVTLIGAGYLSSVAHLYFTYSGADGKPGLSPDDVRIQLAGRRDRTLIESKIAGGSMEKFIPDRAERTRILNWVHGGATAATFGQVQPIFTQRCVGCHNPEGPSKFRPLTNFQEVAAVAQVDKGETPAGWARVAHIHLQSLSVIYLLLGLIF